MSLIKKPVYNNLRAAIRSFGGMALSPFAKGTIDTVDAVVPERTYELEEYEYKTPAGNRSVIAMWGEADYFVLYADTDVNAQYIGSRDMYVQILDGVHEDDNTHQQLDEDLLHLLARCMLVGYVPKALLKAIHDYGRGGPQGDFTNIFGECIDNVEDILESFESQ